MARRAPWHSVVLPASDLLSRFQFTLPAMCCGCFVSTQDEKTFHLTEPGVSLRLTLQLNSLQLG